MYHPDGLGRNSIIDHERGETDLWRMVLATLVICVGVAIAVFALWQARTTRTVYIPIPMETPSAPGPARPVAVEGTVGGNPNVVDPFAPASAPPSRVVVRAPAMPISQPVASSAAMPIPVDYAARDRRIASLKQQIEEIDETMRRVRADPHWYGIVKNSTDTSRQQASDVYLARLDKQRNDLRREKWALEGR